MIFLSKNGAVDAVFIHSLDRLSRDTYDLNRLVGDLQESGCQVWFVHGLSGGPGATGTSALDKLVLNIHDFKGEQEREDIKRRTMDGKRQTALNGRLPTGAGRGLYGYAYNWEIDEYGGKPRGRREIIPEEAAIVRQIFEWCVSGYCDYDIARKLNDANVPTKAGSKWHPLTVRRVLTNRGYAGVTYYGREHTEKVKNSKKRIRTFTDKSEWIAIEGFTPAIISEEIFETVQRRMAEPKQRTGRAIIPYLLSGHLLCGYCNTPLVGAMMSRKYRYYRCRATFPTATRPRTCQAHYISCSKLEEAVWEVVEQVLENPDVVLTEMRRLRSNEETPIEEEIARIKKEIHYCDDEGRRLVKLYQLGEIDDDWIKIHAGPIKMKKQSYQRELEQLTAQKVMMNDLERLESQVEAYCQRLREGLSAFDFEEKRKALKALQVKVIVTETDLRVKGILGVAESDSAFITIVRTSALQRGCSRRSREA